MTPIVAILCITSTRLHHQVLIGRFFGQNESSKTIKNDVKIYNISNVRFGIAFRFECYAKAYRH